MLNSVGTYLDKLFIMSYRTKVNVRQCDNDEMAFSPYRPLKKRRLIGRCPERIPPLIPLKPTLVASSNKMTGHITVHHWNEGAGRRIGQKTFVSTCQFLPKRVPVRYTETLIMHLNSTKRKYYESVSYETKMVPSQWSQTMFVDVIPGDDRIVNEVTIPCENYISLIPQQVIAQLSIPEIPETEIDDKENCHKQTNHKSTKTMPLNNNQKHRAGRTEFNDAYYKNTCQEFLNELRKMY